MKKNVIWITGASSGIGAELAKQYAEEGALLILSARREKALQEVKNSCENQENITVLPFDLNNLSVSTNAASRFDGVLLELQCHWCFGEGHFVIGGG